MFSRKWYKLISIISGIVLLLLGCFLMGFYVGEYQFYPYWQLRHVDNALQAYKRKLLLEKKQITKTKKYQKYPFQWMEREDRDASSGVVIKKEDQIQRGYTLFTDGTSSARLIDMDGNILHRWSKSFSSVWPDPDHIIDEAPDDQIYWRNTRLFPNGDLLVIFEGTGTLSPYGGGIMKIDKNSNVIWKVGINAHHDFEVRENDGTIYVLSHRYETWKKRSVINDYLTVLEADGEIREHRSILKAFQETPYRRMLPEKLEGDIFHTNGVEVLTEEMADDFPWEAGDILLSFHRIGLGVLDGKSFGIKWFLPVINGVHDADFLPGGRLMYFHNNVEKNNQIGSRIEVYDPFENKRTWSYSNFDDFHSKARGAQGRLANGNILVTESHAGTIFEITPNKEVVWKYVTEHKTTHSILTVHWAKRYLKDYCQFLDQTEDPEVNEDSGNNRR